MTPEPIPAADQDPTDPEPGFKSVSVTCRWETTHDVVIPEDEQIGSTLGDWADQVDTSSASLVDWW